MEKLTDLLAELATAREAIKELQAQEKVFKTEQRELEHKIAIRLQEQGLDKISNDICTVSIKTEIVPTVENWDDVFEHISQTNQFELLHKRMSSTAYRELIASGTNVPGVKSTELTRINFRSL
tara:strand:- start:372 stop:740 length:369 start_codon:yes stop_codon:yes gene_type:complete